MVSILNNWFALNNDRTLHLVNNHPCNAREGKAMKIVNDHCSSHMLLYSKCVEKFPTHWDSACSSQRHELARCSETHPTMMKVKMKCNSHFQSYERCQKKYPDDPTRCSSGFKTFLDCVESVTENHSTS